MKIVKQVLLLSSKEKTGCCYSSRALHCSALIFPKSVSHLGIFGILQIVDGMIEAQAWLKQTNKKAINLLWFTVTYMIHWQTWRSTFVLLFSDLRLSFCVCYKATFHVSILPVSWVDQIYPKVQTWTWLWHHNVLGKNCTITPLPYFTVGRTLNRCFVRHC